MIKYHFHFKCSTWPLAITELWWNSRKNYGQFETYILQEGDLITVYCSEQGFRDQYNYGKARLFNRRKSQLIFKKIDKIDKELQDFSFDEAMPGESIINKRKKWLNFYLRAKEINGKLAEIYFIMESMALSPLADFIEKICERDGLLSDQVLHNISLATKFSSEEKRLVAVLNDLGRKKLLLHDRVIPIFLQFYKLYDFISKTAKIPLSQVIMMTDKEIIEFLKKKKISSGELKKRCDGAIVITGRKSLTYAVLYGSAYREWKLILEPDFKEEIKGTVACRGRIRGRVSLHLSWIHTRKVPAGDVLVAGNTNPQMVPFLKDASAIVTDEGGLTCHAAIISRELGIPCVVGTKVATRVLHDGDLVEVDAERGIVRILKKG